MLIQARLPARNAERTLAANVEALRECFVCWEPADTFEILVVSNGSHDGTVKVAKALAGRFADVQVLELCERGRGRDLRQAWLGSEADVLVYMDVDLSTDLTHLPELVRAVASGESDLAVGSRLLPPRDIERGWLREVLSRSYNQLIRHWFGTQFSDAQCGFKAISRRAAHALLPLVEDNHWFFDTELLVIAEQAGCRIHDLPVRWQDHAATSTIKIVPTILQMLRGMARLKRRLRHGLAEEARARLQAAGAVGKQCVIQSVARDPA